MNANLLRRVNWLWKHRHTHDDDNFQEQITLIRQTVEAEVDATGDADTRVPSLTVAASDAREDDRDYANYRCDGEDDDVEIQAALDALSSTGGTVWLTSGTFSLGSAVLLPGDNLTLRGMGPSTVLKLADGADANVIRLNSKSFLHFYDFKIDGNKANQSSGDGGIVEVGSAGGAHSISIDRVSIDDMLGHGVHADDASSGWRVDSCHITDCDQEGVLFEGSDSSVTDSFITGCRNGILLDNAANWHMTIVGNTVRGCSENGIAWGLGRYVAIVGNVSRNNTQSGITAKGTVDNCQYGTIAGNTCNQNGRYGVELGNGTDGDSKHVAVIANNVEDNTLGGVREGTSTDVIAHNLGDTAHSDVGVDELVDVSASSPSVGDVLKWDDPNSEWIAGPVTYADHLELGGLTGATDSSRYVGATTSGAPVSGTFAVGDFVVAQDGNIYVCTSAGSPGTWTAVGSAAATDANAIHDDTAGELAAMTEKATPVNADLLYINDSEDSNNPKAVQVGNLPSSGGGGGSVPGWIDYLLQRQSDETSHADDKFFGDGETLGGTEVTPTGSVTWTKKRDRLYVNASGQSSSDVAARLWALTPSTSPVTLEVAVSLWRFDENFPGVGLVFADGTTAGSNAIVVFLYKGEAQSWHGTLTSLSTEGQNISRPVTTQPIGEGPLSHVRLIWTASNTFKHGISVDGENWVYTSTVSKTMTPSHFGVHGTAWGHGSLSGMGAFEYLRVNESDLSA